MSEEVVPEESDDFDVEFRIRLPWRVARRLNHAADARRADAGPLASAIVAKALGAEVHVPPAQVVRKLRLADPAVQAEVRMLHEAGMTPSEIAANLDVKRQTAIEWLRTLGLEVVPQRAGGRTRVEEREKSERFKRLAAQRDELEAAS